MEPIKIEFNHISKSKPLIKILVDGKIYKNLEISFTDPIIIECDVKQGRHTIEIIHYGKNYFTDNDKSFELKSLKINDVDIKYEIFKFKQYPDLPPWEEWHIDHQPVCWENNLYLGHNGKIVYNDFETPSVEWFKKKFVNSYRPDGMQSSNTTLALAKQFYENEVKRNFK